MTFEDFLALLCAWATGASGGAAIDLFFRGEIVLGFAAIGAALLSVFIAIAVILVGRRL
jgi:hypothetical protein